MREGDSLSVELESVVCAMLVLLSRRYDDVLLDLRCHRLGSLVDCVYRELLKWNRRSE